MDENKDWEAACAEMCALRDESRKLQIQSDNDAEALRDLQAQMRFLEGQIEAFKFCASHGSLK